MTVIEMNQSGRRAVSFEMACFSPEKSPRMFDSSATAAAATATAAATAAALTNSERIKRPESNHDSELYKCPIVARNNESKANRWPADSCLGSAILNPV